MTEVEERYVHFVSCIEWLNEAWALLGELRGNTGAKFAGAAFRFALIQYAKPYKVSHGTQRRKLKLDDQFVPAKRRALHERIISRRDQLHAHTDLTVSDAVLYVGEFQGDKRAVLSRNHIDPLQDMRDIEEIIALVEGTLDAMYLERSRLESALRLSV